MLELDVHAGAELLQVEALPVDSDLVADAPRLFGGYLRGLCHVVSPVCLLSTLVQRVPVRPASGCEIQSASGFLLQLTRGGGREHEPVRIAERTARNRECQRRTVGSD